MRSSLVSAASAIDLYLSVIELMALDALSNLPVSFCSAISFNAFKLEISVETILGSSISLALRVGTRPKNLEIDFSTSSPTFSRALPTFFAIVPATASLYNGLISSRVPILKGNHLLNLPIGVRQLELID